MLNNDRLGTKTWRLLSLLACASAPFAGCSGPNEEASRSTAQALVGEGIVISQVYGGGGANSGSPTYQRDFVELFNRGTVPASLNGLSLQYGAAAGDFGSQASNIYALPDITIDPGHYYLVGMAPGSAGPALDVDTVGTLTLSATNGKVALARSASALECGGTTDAGVNRCTAEKVLDMVGYGTASDYEGPSAPKSSAVGTLSTTTAASRKGNGCTDTDVNIDDFTVGVPAPRHASSPANECALDGGSPDAEVDANPGIDAGPADGGGGTPEDAGTDAASPEDGGTGPTDAGPSDASTDDGGANDGGPQGDGTGIVISQIFGAGGNSGATFSRDYVELFNRSNDPVSLAGLSVQYGSAAQDFANNSFTVPIVLPNVTLPKGGYFLVALSGGDAGTGAGLPTPDVEGLSNLSTTKGKVALARVTTPLGCGGATRCPDSVVIDKVGYGDNTVTDWLGNSRAPAPATGENTSAIVRKSNGCQDTRNNDADFALTKPAPIPHNSSSPAAPCGNTPSDAGTDSGTGGQDAGKSDSGTGNPYDSGTPPRNDAGGGNGAIDVDSGCSCSTPGTGTPMDKGIAFGAFAALGLAITARRRRAS